MLLEVLFGVTFFLLPIVGMFGAVLARALNNEGVEEGEERVQATIKRSIRRSAYPQLALVDNKVMHYQLVESYLHRSIVFPNFKEQIHPRAGP